MIAASAIRIAAVDDHFEEINRQSVACELGWHRACRVHNVALSLLIPSYIDIVFKYLSYSNPDVKPNSA